MVMWCPLKIVARTGPWDKSMTRRLPSLAKHTRFLPVNNSVISDTSCSLSKLDIRGLLHGYQHAASA